MTSLEDKRRDCRFFVPAFLDFSVPVAARDIVTLRSLYRKGTHGLTVTRCGAAGAIKGGGAMRPAVFIKNEIRLSEIPLSLCV